MYFKHSSGTECILQNMLRSTTTSTLNDLSSTNQTINVIRNQSTKVKNVVNTQICHLKKQDCFPCITVFFQWSNHIAQS